MRVCFVAPAAYPLFDPSVEAPVGGIERRSVLFARALAARPGYEVVFRVADFGQPERQRIDGIEVLSRRPPAVALRRRLAERARRVRASLPRKEGFPGFRVARVGPDLFWNAPLAVSSLLIERGLGLVGLNGRPVFRPRPSGWYRRVGADACVGFGVNSWTARMVASCRRFGATSVLFLASNANLSPIYRPGSRERDPDGEFANACHYALAHADHVLAQSEDQRALLERRFGREARVLRNPVLLPRERPEPRREYVLWIGRADRHHKRPVLLLDLAARCPEVPFRMVLNPGEPEVARAVAASATPNVTIVERVPPAAVAEIFRGAAAYASTSSSEFEGFPNVFLEAASHGVPVLSLEADPDGLFEEDGARGFCARGDVARLAAAVRRVWSEPAAGRRMAEGLWEHARRHHDADGQGALLDAYLREICAR